MTKRSFPFSLSLPLVHCLQQCLFSTEEIILEWLMKSYIHTRIYENKKSPRGDALASSVDVDVCRRGASVASKISSPKSHPNCSSGLPALSGVTSSLLVSNFHSWWSLTSDFRRKTFTFDAKHFVKNGQNPRVGARQSLWHKMPKTKKPVWKTGPKKSRERKVEREREPLRLSRVQMFTANSVT